MAAVTLTYACEACAAESTVRVSGLKIPDVPVNKKNRVFFLPPDEAKRQIEAGTAQPISVKTKSLEELAREVLRFATCPKCSARNPLGVDLQRKLVLKSRMSGLALLAVCMASAWYFPTFGFATPVLALGFTLLNIYTRRLRRLPLDRTLVFIGFAGPLALAAFSRAYPNLAWLVPLPLLGPELLRPQAGRDFEWKAAAERVRFLD